MDKNIFEDLTKQLDGVHKVLQDSAKGLPKQLKALKDLKKNEAEMIELGVGKLDNVLGNIGKEMKSLENLIKYGK